jgi:hypothetical protein
MKAQQLLGALDDPDAQSALQLYERLFASDQASNTEMGQAAPAQFPCSTARPPGSGLPDKACRARLTPDVASAHKGDDDDRACGILASTATLSERCKHAALGAGDTVPGRDTAEQRLDTAGAVDNRGRSNSSVVAAATARPATAKVLAAKAPVAKVSMPSSPAMPHGSSMVPSPAASRPRSAGRGRHAAAGVQQQKLRTRGGLLAPQQS